MSTDDRAASEAIRRDALVPRRLIENVRRVLQPRQIWLFGSRARGDASADSDWDLIAVLDDTAASWS